MNLRKKSQLELSEALDYLSRISEASHKDVGGDGTLKFSVGAFLASITTIHQKLKERFSSTVEDHEIYQKIRSAKYIMQLIESSIQRIGKDFSTDEENNIIQSKEYRSFKTFYDKHISGYIEKNDLEMDLHEENFAELLHKVDKGIKHDRLKDIESVKEDRDYELFFIRDEEDKPYFQATLLKHIHLLGNADYLLSHVSDNDPIQSINQLQDQMLHNQAKKIKEKLKPLIDQFYQKKLGFQAKEIYKKTQAALIALSMSANEKNLLSSGASKSCYSFFTDFHKNLRVCLEEKSFFDELVDTEEASLTYKLLLQLVYLFFVTEINWTPFVEFFGEIITKNKAVDSSIPKGQSDQKNSLHQELLDNYKTVGGVLSRFPYGPVLKALDAICEKNSGFDPIKQENFPCGLYSFGYKGYVCQVIHTPMPIQQKNINHCSIVPDFWGLISLLSEGKDRYLYVNLLDRFSSKQSFPSKKIEQFSMKAENIDSLKVVTLSVTGSFYWQEEEYTKSVNSEIFLKNFKNEVFPQKIKSLYYFSDLFGEKNEKSFDDVVHAVHKEIFDSQDSLNYEERCIFIDFTHVLLVIKIMDMWEINLLSFSCKDGVDEGALMNSIFFAFLCQMSKNALPQKNVQRLQLLMERNAMMVRHRLMDRSLFDRTLRALAKIDTLPPKVIKNLVSTLFPDGPWEKISLEIPAN